MAYYYEKIIIKDNRFRNNSGDLGGDLSIKDYRSKLTITGNHLENNYVNRTGGAVYVDYYPNP